MSPPASKPSPAAPVPAAPDDASIPMLTERLTLPPLELDTTLPHDASDATDDSAPVLLAHEQQLSRPGHAVPAVDGEAGAAPVVRRAGDRHRHKRAGQWISHYPQRYPCWAAYAAE